jgi:Cu(I)/Ag(I) efflux system membrane fusion protein
MKAKNLLFLLPVLTLLVATCDRHPRQATDQWYCPMHPAYISDRPGDCPICGMKLVPKSRDQAPARSPAEEPPEKPASESVAGGEVWVCPMPEDGIVQDHPGKCPKCGMALVRKKEPQQSASGRRILYYRNPMNPGVTSPVPRKDEMGMDYLPVYADQVTPAVSGVPGMATVEMSPEGLRLTGVQTVAASRQRLERKVRAVGVVAADESRISRLHTKISGWVERLFVNQVGQAVKKGQPLLSIYSPELLATQEEFLRALQAAKRFSNSSLAEVRRGAEQLLAAARRRLELFDVPAGFIERLERSAEVERAVTLLAPTSGFVISKAVFEGQRIEPGSELMTLADLERVWIEAELYENEAAGIRPGQAASVTLSYDPSTQLSGRVALVFPVLNTETRTLKVRLEFENRQFLLRPGAFVNVELVLEAADGVVIPDSAVLDSGERQLVFIKRQNGLFEPLRVKVGLRSGGLALIKEGLEEGEWVVVRANFLLDSESRLRSVLGGGG